MRNFVSRVDAKKLSGSEVLLKTAYRLRKKVNAKKSKLLEFRCEIKSKSCYLATLFSYFVYSYRQGVFLHSVLRAFLFTQSKMVAFSFPFECLTFGCGSYIGSSKGCRDYKNSDTCSGDGIHNMLLSLELSNRR